MSHHVRHVAFVGLVGVVLGTHPSGAWAYTVGKECIENFHGCPGLPNLPSACDLTDGAGNFGGELDFYYKNDQVFEQHLVDVSLQGWDVFVADDVDVYLFSGHGTGNGSDNKLGLSTPRTSCSSHASSGAPQEILFDRDAELAFFDASCSGSLPERYAVWYEGGGNGMMIDLKQGFAFRNSPEDTDGRFYKFYFYASVYGMSNKDAWLEASGGTGCLPFDCEFESPIVFTKGNSATDAQNRANGMKLSNFQSYSTPTGNYYWYYSEFYGGEC